MEIARHLGLGGEQSRQGLPVSAGFHLIRRLWAADANLSAKCQRAIGWRGRQAAGFRQVLLEQGLAPFGDWRKFTRRNLGADQPQPAVASPPVESPPPPPPPPPSVVVEPPPFEPVFPTPRPVVVGEVDEDLADTPWDGDTVAGDESVEIIDNEAAPQPSPAP